MKRDENIIPLSRDHHYSLLFCWKIREGIDKGIDLDRIRSYVLYFWNNNLQEHFQEEETLLFKTVSEPLCQQALDEHQRIRELVRRIRGSGGRLKDNYTALAGLVSKHVRFEERQLFPCLEKKLTKEQLSQVGEQLRKLHARPTDDLYEDTFWS